MATKRTAKQTVAEVAPPDSEENYRTTSISLPPDVLELLVDLAFKRKKTRGGRASVSALVLELVERHRAELEKELKG